MISRLSFDIADTHDFKTLGIVDTSWYNSDIKVETPTIEILPPGYVRAVSPYFVPGALNIYNSNGVGITQASCEEELQELPDGIWKIKYSICPNDKLFIERYFLRTDKILCRYSQAFLSLDINSCDLPTEKQRRSDLDNIRLYITGAIAAANDQNPKLASDLYNKANKLLDKFSRSNCNC